MDVEELFEMMYQLEQDNGKSIDDSFVENEEVLALSNSYCEQCGDCCKETALEGADGISIRECSNLESRDGLYYCLLHSEEYPGGKQVPDLMQAAAERLDPAVWAKPKCCHIYGPRLILFSMIEAKRERNPGLLECVTCPGGLKMLEEYRAFAADK